MAYRKKRRSRRPRFKKRRRSRGVSALRIGYRM